MRPGHEPQLPDCQYFTRRQGPGLAGPRAATDRTNGLDAPTKTPTLWSICVQRRSIPTAALWSRSIGFQWRSILHGVFLMFVAFACPKTAADPRYSLSPPRVYYVLCGDLHVNYSRPSDVIMPHAFVRIEYWSKTRNRAVEVQSLGLAMDRSSGELVVACGVLEIAGSYSLRMYTHRGGTQLAQASLDVQWPHITLSLPSTVMTALTSAAKLEVNSAAICVAKREQFQFRVKLYHRRRDASMSGITEDGRVQNGNIEDLWKSAEELSEIRFPAIDNNVTTLSLGCHLFDLDGLYRAVLVSTSPDAPPVSTSNALRVTWGHSYQLSVSRDSVFPCSKPFSVWYSFPVCTGTNDRIRLYSRTRTAAGSPAAPLDRNYVKEIKVNTDTNKMELECDLFSKEASGFCVTYASVTRGHVFTDQAESCFPSYPNSVFPTAGHWGQWTSWGACSVTCGAGKKQRFRLCDSPPPRHGGEYCHGGHVEWTPCIKHCPDMLPRTPLHSPVLEPSCRCGCTKDGDNQGKIVATGRCQGMSTWTVRVNDGQDIIFRFDYFHLNYSQQWLRIRDGGSPSDRLLFSSFDSGYPVEVVTSGPVARVEFMTYSLTPALTSTSDGPVTYRDLPIKASLPIHINGFIVSYRSSAAPATTAGPLLFQHREEPAMHSGVTIAGIAICAAAVVVAIVFVLVQRFTAKGRRAKYAMTASASTESPAQGGERGREEQAKLEESPAQRALSSGQSSSSPSSQGITVDMEVPLTGKLRRKAGSGDGAEASGDLDSTGHRKKKKKKKKKLMVRIDVNPVALRSSQQAASARTGGSPTKASSNEGSSSPTRTPAASASVKSPHGLEVIDTDQVVKVGRASPTGAQHEYVSISPPPKHHRSHHRHHRDRDQPKTAATKFDLLRKLRQARGNDDVNKHDLSRSSKSTDVVPSDIERDVTGSSGSRSPVSVATTKAEVNWPRATNGDSGGVGGAANFVRAALHEVVGRTFAGSATSSDRHKRSAAAGLGYHQQPQRRPASEEIPLMDSMTSSLDSPSHFNTMVKSESQDSATTSFVNRGDGLPPARRPTSLTASYSSTVSNEGNSPAAQHPQQKPTPFNRPAAKPTAIPRPSKPSPSALTPSSSSIPPPPTASEIKSSHPHSESNKRTLPQLRSFPQPSSSSTAATRPHQKGSKPASQSVQPPGASPQTPTPTQPLIEERLSSLPKPDGQSPRLYKRESLGPSTPCSKTLTRTANPQTCKSDTSKNSDLGPISISTSTPSGPGRAPGSKMSPRNLGIPPHLQGKKSPGNPDNMAAQAQSSPTRGSGKGTPTSQGPPSPGKLSKGSSKASRSNLSSSMASPTRSIPSEVEGLELEYDDFIEDDPLSYFDYEETMKLTFRGKERIGKSPVEEEEEEEAGEATKIQL